MPWGLLWLAVPLATAVALLVAWRFGRWALIAPIALAGVMPALAGPGALWAWWIPTGALVGAWMGLVEERGSPTGQRAWTLVPALMLAAALPWAQGYRELVAA